MLWLSVVFVVGVVLLVFCLVVVGCILFGLLFGFVYSFVGGGFWFVVGFVV